MGKSFVVWLDRRSRLVGIRTQVDLAEASGISGRTINRIYAESKLGECNRSTRIWLARTLKVSLRDLEAIDEGRIKDIPDDRIVEWDHSAGVAGGVSDARGKRPVAVEEGGVPVLGRVAAGGMVESVEDFDEELGRRLPISFPGTSRVFALEIDGDSMEPEYRRGAFIVVQDWDPARLEDGDDAVVQLDGAGDGKASFKRVFIMPGGKLKLVSLNPAYEPFNVTAAEVVRVGKVMGTFVARKSKTRKHR
jgi:SOS-response transcriptional repressor LexA